MNTTTCIIRCGVITDMHTCASGPKSYGITCPWRTTYYPQRLDESQLRKGKSRIRRKKDPDPNKASDGVIPLPRENASKSAIIQATMREIEADYLNITGEANQVE